MSKSGENNFFPGSSPFKFSQELKWVPIFKISRYFVELELVNLHSGSQECVDAPEWMTARVGPPHALSPPIPHSHVCLGGSVRQPSHCSLLSGLMIALLFVTFLSSFLIECVSFNKHGHHLSFQTDWFGQIKSQWGFLVKLLPSTATARVLCSGVLLLPWGESSHGSSRNCLSQMCGTGPALHPPELSPTNPNSRSLAPKEAFRGVPGWPGSTSQALPSRVAGVWCRPSLHIKAFGITLFQFKSLKKSSWHLAGDESKVPSQPGGRKHLQPNKAPLLSAPRHFLKLT